MSKSLSPEGRKHREEVGRRIKITREALEQRPSEFAARLGLSTQSALWNIEKGVAYPSIDAILRACSEYGLTFDWVFRGQKSGLDQKTAAKISAVERSLN